LVSLIVDLLKSCGRLRPRPGTRFAGQNRAKFVFTQVVI
jgi:hypothetical protein